MEWDKVRETDSDTSYSRQTDREKDTTDTTDKHAHTEGQREGRRESLVTCG